MGQGGRQPRADQHKVSAQRFARESGTSPHRVLRFRRGRRPRMRATSLTPPSWPRSGGALPTPSVWEPIYDARRAAGVNKDPSPRQSNRSRSATEAVVDAMPGMARDPTSLARLLERVRVPAETISTPTTGWPRVASCVHCRGPKVRRPVRGPIRGSGPDGHRRPGTPPRPRGADPTGLGSPDMAAGAGIDDVAPEGASEGAS